MMTTPKGPNLVPTLRRIALTRKGREKIREFSSHPTALPELVRAAREVLKQSPTP